MMDYLNIIEEIKETPDFSGFKRLSRPVGKKDEKIESDGEDTKIRERIAELENFIANKPRMDFRFSFLKGMLRFFAFIILYFGTTLLLQNVFGETSIPVVAAAIVIIMYFNPWAIIAFIVTAPFGLWEALLTLLKTSNANRAMEILSNSTFVKSGIGEPFYIAIMIVGVIMQPYFFRIIAFLSQRRVYKKNRKKALKEIKPLKGKLQKIM